MTATIQSIVTQPGLGVVPGQEILSLGLLLDNGFVAWGECVADPTTNFSAQEAITSVERVVRPFLQNQPLTTFRDLSTKLNRLTEVVTITETTYVPANQASGPSRRDLLRGQWMTVPKPPQPILQQREIERPLLAPLRYGLSQALWQAMAHVQQKSLLAVLCEEYELARPQTAVPLHIEIDPYSPLSVETIIHNPIASLGYSISGNDPAAELGTNGEILQRFVRQLKEQLIGIVEPESFAFYLNVRGGYGKLYGNQLGKILGALVGLEKAAAPFLVRLVDPLIVNGRNKHIQQMATLRSYLQGRRMKLELVAHTGLETAVDAEAFVAGKAAHMLHLDLPQIGSMDEAITAAQICQQHDISVLWGGSPEETALAARLSVHAALAVQPTLLLVKFGRLGRSGISLTSNEMNRILASAKAVP